SGDVHHTIGFVESIERMRGPSLPLAPSAMASVNNQWCSDQTISNLSASASAFHVQLRRSGSTCGSLATSSFHTCWNEKSLRSVGFAVRLVAVVITGLSLIAPAAHAFELLNKIGLPKAEYFIVQQIYSGWRIAGLLLALASMANVANAIVMRDDKSA